jgi:hypothetical protein
MNQYAYIIPTFGIVVILFSIGMCIYGIKTVWKGKSK